MRSTGQYPVAVAAVVGATALATIYETDGWLLWIPVVLALIVADNVRARLGR